MNSAMLALALTVAAGCSAPQRDPGDEAAPAPAPTAATDDGTYLARIDPLGGQWRVLRLGAEDFTRFGGWIDFSAGGFMNHGAGCSGGYPAFYRLEGARIAVVRREAIQVGKCAGTPELANGTAARRATAGESERRLAAFLDQLSGWQRDGDALVLTARDGTEAVLTRPPEPHPAIAGRWLIESIGGEPLVTERRPATLSIARGGIGASADCNAFGGSFVIPAPGKLAVSGPMVSTLIGCAPEDAAEDALMADAIAAASAYRVSGDRLVLSGGPGLEARRFPAPDRQLRGEYAHCGNTLLGAYHKGPIELSIDQTEIRDNAGCSARFAASGPQITLELESGPACTQAAPPYVPGEPVEVGGDISILAVARPDAFAFNDEGLLALRTSRGLLTMCRKGASPPFGA